MIFFDENDNSIVWMITERCNSNCIMCPMSADTRKRGKGYTDNNPAILLSELPSDITHIDITGGEPFLNWKKALDVMKNINIHFPQTPVLVLTNGRALSLSFLQKEIQALITAQYRFAIPLHAPNAMLHDKITQSCGSFEQTIDALHFLSGTKAEVEIRIVGSRVNAKKITDLCEYIIDDNIKVDTVNLIGMEMNGQAARNRKQLWIDYDQLYTMAEPGLISLVENGIDVGLYGFPLCALPKRAWAIAKHGIATEKIRYYDACDRCIEKKACGGLFKSTYLLGIYQVKPFEKE